MAGTASLALATRDLWMQYRAYSTANTFPADSVGVGTAWGSGWIILGYSTGGIEFNAQSDYNELKVDQTPVAIINVAIGQTVELASNLVEITVPTLQLATGQGTIGTSAGTAGHTQLDIAGNPTITYYGVGADAQMQDGYPLRVFLPRAQSVGQVQAQINAEQLSQIAARFRATPDANSVITPNLICSVRDVGVYP